MNIEEIIELAKNLVRARLMIEEKKEELRQLQSFQAELETEFNKIVAPNGEYPQTPLIIWVNGAPHAMLFDSEFGIGPITPVFSFDSWLKINQTIQ